VSCSSIRVITETPRPQACLSARFLTSLYAPISNGHARAFGSLDGKAGHRWFFFGPAESLQLFLSASLLGVTGWQGKRCRISH
jgi:hypothetical protein